jgi:hypothetical protein
MAHYRLKSAIKITMGSGTPNIKSRMERMVISPYPFSFSILRCAY